MLKIKNFEEPGFLSNVPVFLTGPTFFEVRDALGIYFHNVYFQPALKRWGSRVDSHLDQHGAQENTTSEAWKIGATDSPGVREVVQIVEDEGNPYWNPISCTCNVYVEIQKSIC